jgi:hypothetical protein
MFAVSVRCSGVPCARPSNHTPTTVALGTSWLLLIHGSSPLDGLPVCEREGSWSAKRLLAGGQPSRRGGCGISAGLCSRILHRKRRAVRAVEARLDRWCRCRLKLQGLPGLLARGGLHRGHAHLLRKRRCLWWRFGLFGFRLPFLAIASLFTLCHGKSPRGSRAGGDGSVDLYLYRQRVLLGRATVGFPVGHAAGSGEMG